MEQFKPKMFIYNEQGEVLDFAPEVYSIVAPEILLSSGFSNTENLPIIIDWEKIFTSYLKLSEDFVLKFIEKVPIKSIIYTQTLNESIVSRLYQLYPESRDFLDNLDEDVAVFGSFKYSLDFIRKYKDRIPSFALMYSGFYTIDDILGIYEDKISIHTIIHNHKLCDTLSGYDSNGLYNITNHKFLNKNIFEITKAYLDRFNVHTTDELSDKEYADLIIKIPKLASEYPDEVNWDKFSRSVGLATYDYSSDLDKYIKYADKINWKVVQYDKIITRVDTEYHRYRNSVSNFEYFMLIMKDYIDWELLYAALVEPTHEDRDKAIDIFNNVHGLNHLNAFREKNKPIDDTIDSKVDVEPKKEQVKYEYTHTSEELENLVDTPYSKKKTGRIARFFRKNK